jgi:FMN-dependent NADH-azoreductase
MSTVLVLTSSVLGDASASNQLVHDAVAQIKSQDPQAAIVTRDLVADPIPHLTPDSASVLRGATPENQPQPAALTLSNALVDELRAADTIVIGAPMYNFGIASSLKSWFDYVLRAGVTFSYSEAGPKGLLHGKRAIVILTRGGLYSEGPAQQMDSQEPHLRTLLGFIGITDIIFVRAEKLGLGPEQREQSMAAARSQLQHAVWQPASKAA